MIMFSNSYLQNPLEISLLDPVLHMVKKKKKRFQHGLEEAQGDFRQIKMTSKRPN